MCKSCNQPDWYCHHAQHGSKQIKNEPTGYSILTIDFMKKSILKFNGTDNEVIDFPEEWETMNDFEKKAWILGKINLNKSENGLLKKELDKIRRNKK